MKAITCAKLLAGFVMSVAMSAHATIISVSGNSFDDLGNSTIDLSTQLEWRDIHLTNGRSQCSVAKDTGSAIPAGCSTFDNLDLISDAEGWRYATRGEVAQLLSNWMGIAIGTTGSYVVDSTLNAQFRSVFADGSNFIRPDFMQDHLPNPVQAVGFGSTGSSIFMDFYNGSINGACCNQGSVLVREASVDVPEPTSLALMALALTAFGFFRRRS